MQRVEIELNGERRQKTVAQLRLLRQMRLIDDRTPIWLDGYECKFGDVADQVAVGASVLTLQCPVDSPTHEKRDAKPKANKVSEPAPPPLQTPEPRQAVLTPNGSGKTPLFFVAVGVLFFLVSIGLVVLAYLATTVARDRKASESPEPPAAQVESDFEATPELPEEDDVSDEVSNEDETIDEETPDEETSEDDVLNEFVADEETSEEDDFEEEASTSDDDEPFDVSPRSGERERFNDADDDQEDEEEESDEESPKIELVSVVDDAGYLLTPFDRDVTVLPENFRGHSVQSTFHELEKIKRLRLEEDESDREFARRVIEREDELDGQRLFGSCRFGDCFAFELPVDDCSYDAEEGVLNVRDAFLAKKEFHCDAKFFAGSFLGKYVKAEDKVKPDKLYALFVVGSDERLEGETTWRLSVSADDARALRDELKLVCVCDLTLDGTSNCAYLGKIPDGDFHGIVITEPEFWFYCKSSGEILTKFTLEDLANEHVASCRIKRAVKPQNDTTRNAKTRNDKEYAAPLELTVKPDESLDDALTQLFGYGGSILLEPSKKPYRIKSRYVFETNETVELKGDPNQPGAVVVEFDAKSNASLKASGGTFVCKGVTFQFGKGGSNYEDRVMFEFYGKEQVTFENCALDGANEERAIGVAVKDRRTSFKAIGVTFSRFQTGLRASFYASVHIESDSTFIDDRVGASIEDRGRFEGANASFEHNVVGLSLDDYSQGELRDSTFKNNKTPIKLTERSEESFIQKNIEFKE